MQLSDVLEMKIHVGYGENHFTMKRGSFKYNQKIKAKRALSLNNSKVIENGYALLFVDNRQRSFEFHVTEVNEVITIEYQGALLNDVNRFWITLPSYKDEHFYGCGETYSEFDLKGQNVRIWVAEHQNSNRISQKIISEKILGKRPKHKLPFSKYESYYVQPTFTSSKKYYMHVNTNNYAEFDFRANDGLTLYLQDKPSIIIERANSFEELSMRLAKRLGRPTDLPDWVLDGAILAVQGGTDIIDMKIEKALKAGIKVNGIWSQDWCGCRKTEFGYQVMWNWQWDKELYPDLDRKIQAWKDRGIHFTGYINPFIALEKDLYKEATSKGYCVKNKAGEDYQVTITTFPAAMVDFTNPEAYEWYKNIIKENMIGLGMSGWMADFGEYLPVDAVLYSKQDASTLHNEWPAIWAKMNKEAIEECGKQNEIFFFTRAGYTGTIANSTMMWTGDQHVDFSIDDGLGSVIPATLSLAMSGYGLTHSDVGGYTTIMHMRRNKELLLRWEEMNAFSPLYRFHEGNQPINNVQFDADEDLLKHLSVFSNIHYNLKGYLKKTIKELENKGTPVMRPLFYHYDESQAYQESTEYLLGRDILVAPVIEEKVIQRQVYLPNDEWVHLFTKQEYQGGTVMVDAPIGRPPVFIRKNSLDYEALMELSNAEEK